MSRRLFTTPFRPPLPVNGHHYSGRNYVMVTTINATDIGLRIYLEGEPVPSYFHGRSRLRRLVRFDLNSTVKIECQLPEKATSFYLLEMQRNGQETRRLLIEPRSRTFYSLDANNVLTSLARNPETKKIDLPTER